MAVTLWSNSYGKNLVRVMRINRDGYWCKVCELTISVELQLSTSSEYTEGDNKNVVATDSIKNIVYILARQNEVSAYSYNYYTTVCMNIFMRTQVGK